MEYIVEYEVIDSKFCGIVKNPNSGAPLFISDLQNTQDLAAQQVQSFIETNKPFVDPNPPKRCCGRH